MNLKKLATGVAVLVLGFTFVGAAAEAAPAKICFRDVREFEAVRTQLPASLQAGTVHAIHKSISMRGGFRVYQAGARFVIEAKGKSLIGRLDEDQNIKVLCVEGAKIQVWLDDGRYDEITLDPKGFRFHNFLFKITTPEKYFNLVDSI